MQESPIHAGYEISVNAGMTIFGTTINITSQNKIPIGLTRNDSPRNMSESDIA